MPFSVSAAEYSREQLRAELSCSVAHNLAGSKQGRPTGEPEPAGLHKAVLDAMPHPVFVVDEDVRILDCNTAAEQLLGKDPALRLYQRSGDALHCIHAHQAPGGCGSTPACRDCIIRNSVREAFSGAKISRRRCPMQLVKEEGPETEVQMLVTTGPIDFDSRRLVLLVLEDITELLALRKIIPICAGCRKVRDDEQYWQKVEAYFTSRLGIDFSHGICPDCAARLYPELSGMLAK